MKISLRKSKVILLAIIAALTLGLVGVFLWQHNKVTQLSTKVKELNQKITTDDNRNRELLRQVNEIQNKNTNYTANNPCQTSQLALSEEGGLPSASGGQRGAYFSYLNTSNSICTLTGNPGFLALDNKGQIVPNGPIQTGNNTGSSGPALIHLKPDYKAYFSLEWRDPRGFYPTVPAQYYCVTASLIESTPPGNTLPVLASVSGTDICNDGLVIGPIVSTASDAGAPQQ